MQDAPLRIKVVSRRPKLPEDPVRDTAILQRTLNDLRGCGLVPKGVYRFHTHEEADQWMMRQLAANPALRRSKT